MFLNQHRLDIWLKTHAGGAAALLLDSISTAATAGYSTRKISAAYAGSAIQVRRDNDNATQDIGFVNNDLDTSALTTFVGANSGLVSKWYDQSGNGRDFVQATAATQPRIVQTGVVTTVNGHPAVLFVAGGGEFLTSTATVSNLASGTAWSALAGTFINTFTAITAGFNSGTITGSIGGGGFWNPLGIGNDGVNNIFSTAQFTSADDWAKKTISDGVGLVGTGKLESNTLSAWVDGGTATTVASGTLGTLTETLRMGTANSFLDGFLTDVIFYNVALASADLNTLGASMATRIGATWSTIP